MKEARPVSPPHNPAAVNLSALVSNGICRHHALSDDAGGRATAGRDHMSNRMAELLPQTALSAPGGYTLAYDRAYNRLTVAALVPLAALASTVIEMPVMVKRFALPPGRRSFKILLGANLASTAIAALGAQLLLV
jgi:hypothetical protein